ncbi:MAG TPA: hypothetical protein VKA46_33675 [Gemmataceae bacterium]|nr:hypothetical protein [Gemmataceae bacterium]
MLRPLATSLLTAGWLLSVCAAGWADCKDCKDATGSAPAPAESCPTPACPPTIIVETTPQNIYLQAPPCGAERGGPIKRVCWNHCCAQPQVVPAVQYTTSQAVSVPAMSVAPAFAMQPAPAYSLAPAPAFSLAPAPAYSLAPPAAPAFSLAPAAAPAFSLAPSASQALNVPVTLTLSAAQGTASAAESVGKANLGGGTGGTGGTSSSDVSTAINKLSQSVDLLTSIAENHEGRIKKLEQLLSDQKKAIEDPVTGLKALKAQLDNKVDKPMKPAGQ